MAGDLPDYYFRIRENGALVFRVDAENRQRRIEMDQIATINIRNGEVKPHGDRALTAQDLAEIRDWIAHRSHQLAEREVDDILRAVDHMNLTTQWAQTRASARAAPASTCTAPFGFIAAIQQADVSLVRTLIRQGITDVAALPFSPDELSSQILEALAPLRDEPKDSDLGLVTAVVRSSGGCGSTTVLTHLAAALAAASSMPIPSFWLPCPVWLRLLSATMRMSMSRATAL